MISRMFQLNTPPMILGTRRTYVSAPSVVLLLVVALVLVTLATQVLLTWIQRPLDWLGIEGGVIQDGIVSGVPFLLTVGVVLLLYRFVPARRLRLASSR